MDIDTEKYIRDRIAQSRKQAAEIEHCGMPLDLIHCEYLLAEIDRLRELREGALCILKQEMGCQWAAGLSCQCRRCRAIRALGGVPKEAEHGVEAD